MEIFPAEQPPFWYHHRRHRCMYALDIILFETFCYSLSVEWMMSHWLHVIRPSCVFISMVFFGFRAKVRFTNFSVNIRSIRLSKEFSVEIWWSKICGEIIENFWCYIWLINRSNNFHCDRAKKNPDHFKWIKNCEESACSEDFMRVNWFTVKQFGFGG